MAMFRKKSSTVARPDRRDGVIDVSTSLSPAHICHYPCDERAGNAITCAVTGSVISKDGGSGFFYDNPYSIGSDTLDMRVSTNNLSDATEGLLMWYISADMWNWGSPPHPISGNAKLSLQHVTTIDGTYDIQANPTTLPDWTGVAIEQKAFATSAYNYEDYPSRYLQLTGNDAIHNHNGGKTVLVLCAELGSANNYFLIREDGKKFDLPINPTQTWGDGVIDAFYLDEPIPNNDNPAFAGAPHTYVATNMKALEVYCCGAYNFTQYMPSDDEIRAFAKWLYFNSRVGNKQAYPPWADKT